jgi:hypothetical protein
MLYYMWLASRSNKYELTLISMVLFVSGEFYIDYKVQFFYFYTERTVWTGNLLSSILEIKWVNLVIWLCSFLTWMLGFDWRWLLGGCSFWTNPCIQLGIQPKVVFREPIYQWVSLVFTKWSWIRLANFCFFVVLEMGNHNYFWINLIFCFQLRSSSFFFCNYILKILIKK